MSLNAAVRDLFSDPKWLRKIALVSLAGLIPILGFIVILGWGLENFRRKLAHPEDPLPEPTFLTTFSSGFQGWILTLIYTIPIYLLALPLWITPFITDAFTPKTGAAIDLGARIFSFSTIGLYLLWMVLVMPAVFGRFLTANDLGAGLALRSAISDVKSAPREFLTVFLTAILGATLSILGLIACMVGTFFIQAFTAAVIGSLSARACLAAHREQGAGSLEAASPSP